MEKQDFKAKLASKPVSNDVDMEKIYLIESSGNPNAWNKGEDARGLGQIRPIVLKEWNNYNPKDQHIADDLFNSAVNKKIANWYMNKRIPQMLKYFGVPDTAENRIIAYNAGINYHVKGKELPKITKNYLKKYGIQ